jgi:tRNA(Arg) A34 adenosine deaminase TadA
MKIDFFDSMFNLARSTERVSGAKIVAAITKRSRIISYGFNSRKTSPFQKRFAKNEDCICLHAETYAIKNALRVIDTDDLETCSIYVLRVRKESKYGPYITGKSFPCIGCMRAISVYGLRNIYYTEDNSSNFICFEGMYK